MCRCPGAVLRLIERLSFFALWRSVDVHNDDPNSPFPESVLTFGAAGANFHVDALAELLRTLVGDGVRLVGP